MTSAGSDTRDDRRSVTPPRALAHTPEEAAAIIGGDATPSFLIGLARERLIGCLRTGIGRQGAYNFADEHIAEAVAYMTVPASKPAAKARPVKTEPPASPAPEPGAPLLHLKPRELRKRKTA